MVAAGCGAVLGSWRSTRPRRRQAEPARDGDAAGGGDDDHGGLQPAGRARTGALRRRLVPYDKIWCPGADDCTTIAVSTDITIDGKALAAGTYSVWANPAQTKWTIIFNRAHPIFHTRYQSVADQDALTLEVTPRAGTHMETLAFYFPAVNQKHAELVLHWGTVVVPLSIDVP